MGKEGMFSEKMGEAYDIKLLKKMRNRKSAEIKWIFIEFLKTERSRFND